MSSLYKCWPQTTRWNSVRMMKLSKSFLNNRFLLSGVITTFPLEMKYWQASSLRLHSPAAVVS